MLLLCNYYSLIIAETNNTRGETVIIKLQTLFLLQDFSFSVMVLCLLDHLHSVFPVFLN